MSAAVRELEQRADAADCEIHGVLCRLEALYEWCEARRYKLASQKISTALSHLRSARTPVRNVDVREAAERNMSAKAQGQTYPNLLSHAIDCECAQCTAWNCEEVVEDQTPWCSYGHMSKAACDCGPIAENE